MFLKLIFNRDNINLFAIFIVTTLNHINHSYNLEYKCDR